MTSIYSQLKPLHHPDRLEAFRRGERPVPVHVQLILSDLCNQDCGFCAYRMSAGLSSELFAEGPLAKTGHNNPIRQIPTTKAEEIIDDCAAMGVKAIQFTGGGEPTVHKHHRELIGRAQAHGMDTGLVTNGVNLRPDADAIRNLTWIRVSVDAGTAPTYTKVRRVPGGHWTKMWANVAMLAPGYRGTLGVGFVVTPDNYREVADCAWRAHDAGASYIRVGAVFSELGPKFYGDHLPAIYDAIAAAKRDVDAEGFRVVDLFGRRIGDLEVGYPDDARCHYQYLTVYIGGDLNVYRCCNTAYTRAGKVGSLKEQRFRDAVLAYEPFDARGCRACQFLGQNAAIRSMLDEPIHVNFV